MLPEKGVCPQDKILSSADGAECCSPASSPNSPSTTEIGGGRSQQMDRNHKNFAPSSHERKSRCAKAALDSAESFHRGAEMKYFRVEFYYRDFPFFYRIPFVLL